MLDDGEFPHKQIWSCDVKLGVGLEGTWAALKASASGVFKWIEVRLADAGFSAGSSV